MKTLLIGLILIGAMSLAIAYSAADSLMRAKHMQSTQEAQADVCDCDRCAS